MSDIKRYSMEGNAGYDLPYVSSEEDYDHRRKI